MNANEVRTIGDAKQFLQEQESTNAQLINNQRVIPHEIRSYLTTQALTRQQSDGRVFFLAIHNQNPLELLGIWVDTQSATAAAGGHR